MNDFLFSIDPSTGKEIARFPITTNEEVERILNQSTASFTNWSKKSFSERGEHIRNIAALLRIEKENLARLAASEMGKPVWQGREEVEKCATTLEFYAEQAQSMLADVTIKTNASNSFVTYRPLGTILSIMPWNFPFWQVFRAMAPALMAGNTMVLKHASNVSGCALAIQDIVERAGLPQGVFATLLIPSGRVADVIRHKSIAAVTLTGSTEAGKNVASVAGSVLKKAVLELGGSDAYIVLDDVDVQKAARICTDGRLKNSGQSCVAAKRFVVVESVLPQFEQAMVEAMLASKYGNPFEHGVIVGPMARHDLRDQLHEQVLNSIGAGAKLLCGGFLPDEAGAYYPPTVLTNVKKEMPAYEEELFGPVAAIIPVKNMEEAIFVANDSEFGLGGAVISNNIELATRLAKEEVDAGNVFVNHFVFSDARLPFGGIKSSGYGRELGSYGILEFVNVKTVYVA